MSKSTPKARIPVVMHLGNLPVTHSIRPLWQVHQLEGKGWVHPSEVKVGLRIGYPDWALQDFRGEKILEPRWIVGRVKVADHKKDWMTIEFESPPAFFGLAVHCGIEHHAHFCLHVPEDWKP